MVDKQLELCCQPPSRKTLRRGDPKCHGPFSGSSGLLHMIMVVLANNNINTYSDVKKC
jgi:hypothetical protein